MAAKQDLFLNWAGWQIRNPIQNLYSYHMYPKRPELNNCLHQNESVLLVVRELVFYMIVTMLPKPVSADFFVNK